ncbi:MAG: hypothetical protein ACYCSP_16435, partial [Acidobacteriaceae bacterium]
ITRPTRPSKTSLTCYKPPDVLSIVELFLSTNEDRRIYNRMMFAIREHCGEDSRKFFAAMWRIGALLDLYRDERMRPFVVNENDSVHPCIAEVASTMSVNKRGHFNAKKFFERARQLAMERFPSHQLPNITE